MSASDYWHMLEAEGRLKRELREWDAPTLTEYGQIHWHEYYSLRLTPEERERLLYPAFHARVAEWNKEPGP